MKACNECAWWFAQGHLADGTPSSGICKNAAVYHYDRHEVSAKHRACPAFVDAALAGEGE